MPETSIQHLRFIQSEQFSGPGANAEELVWGVVKKAFRDREAIGFWRYPLFAKVGEHRREPDILIADRQLGLVVVEVKGVRIGDIESVEGPVWHFKPGFYTPSASPYQQAQGQMWALLGRMNVEPELMGLVGGRVAVALPLVTAEHWRERGHGKSAATPPILFADDMKPAHLLSHLEQLSSMGGSGAALTDEQWKQVCAALGHSAVFRAEPREETLPPGTMGAIIENARTKLIELDLQQQAIGKQIPPGPQRIRGIAGSGKTVLLAQKAATMHLRYPDWDIALVFFTRSLYQHVIDLVDRWLRAFSNGEVAYDGAVRKKLRVLHAWGARTQPGFYRLVAERMGRQPQGVSQSRVAGYEYAAGLAWCCEQLLKDGQVPQLFDAVLIDEGQDLVVDDPSLLANSRQPFYWLAYSSLRQAKKHGSEKRLIWAYDEAQSLDSLKVPTAADLFGEELSKFVTGMYQGGIRKSEVMHRCYRTPAEVLVAAHALGMGLLRPEGPVSSITNAEGWRSIGYEVEGDFRRAGETIILSRPAENSPAPVGSDAAGALIRFREFPTRYGPGGELHAITESVVNAIRAEHVRPDDILVVVPENSTLTGRDMIRLIAESMGEAGIDYYVASAPRRNTPNTRPDRRPDCFREPGCVTISSLHMAKGNEANLVFVAGLDLIGNREEALLEPPLFSSEQDRKRTSEERADTIIRMRNSLFVAISRSKGWVELTGTGKSRLHDEVRRVLESGTTIQFTNQPGRRSLAMD